LLNFFGGALMKLTLNTLLVAGLVLVGLGCGKAPKKQYTHADMIQILKDDPDPNMRYWAARELGKSKGEDAGASVAALTVALGDPNDLVRAGAAYGLGDLGPAAASAQQALNRVSRDPSAQVREAAAYALKQIDKKK
jgi:HEAT repeat protein